MKQLLLMLVLCALVLLLIGGQYRAPSGFGESSLVSEPYGHAIALGRLLGHGTMHKFGFNDDVDNSEETVWEGPDHGGPARPILDTSAFTLFISSDNGADTEAITVDGIDANWDEVSVDVTLAGNTFTQVGTSSNWLRVNRAFNIGTNDLVGVVYLHIDGDGDGGEDGIPDTTATDIRAIINAGENQTLQAIYTIPDGFTGLLHNWCFSALRSSGTTNPITARLRITPESTVSRTQSRLSIGNPDSFCHAYNPPRAYNARSALEITAVSTGGASNVDVAASFDMLLIPD